MYFRFLNTFTKILLSMLGVVVFNTSFAQNDWKISANGVGIIQLGESIADIRKKVNNQYSTKNNDKDGFDVFFENERLISVWSKRGDGRIGFIKIISNKFLTRDGLRTGLTIPEVEKIRTDFFLELDEMSGQVYFMPKELQTPGEEFYENVNLIYFKSKSGEELVDKFELDEHSKSLRSTNYIKLGFLHYFYIYQWK
ncbi:MAG: hypothetical protein JXQ96_10620 [Cyclobacteriaceae bacterium]